MRIAGITARDIPDDTSMILDQPREPLAIFNPPARHRSQPRHRSMELFAGWGIHHKDPDIIYQQKWQ